MHRASVCRSGPYHSLGLYWSVLSYLLASNPLICESGQHPTHATVTPTYLSSLPCHGILPLPMKCCPPGLVAPGFPQNSSFLSPPKCLLSCEKNLNSTYTEKLPPPSEQAPLPSSSPCVSQQQRPGPFSTFHLVLWESVYLHQ